MEGNRNIDLVNSLQKQIQSLQTRVQELETENAKLSMHLSNIICHKNVESDKSRYLDCSQLNEEMERQRLDENHKKNMSKEKLPDTRNDMALHHLPKRHIALKVMYFGQRFYGFASEAQMDPTIESEIFKALQKTRLISGDRKELHYSRCGRTDKGVSSVGQNHYEGDFEAENFLLQVISLFLRSNLKETAESNGLSVEIFAEESCGGEIDYVKILNRVLPRDIRIIGWSPAPTDFSSRFSCLSREYKYFFWRGSLNIMVMETAGEKFIGEHDFRNFCKMDAANVHNHRRHITSFEIVPCNERFEDDELWAVRIKGSAFLWHQIRCMVAVLFFIGQGLESPNLCEGQLEFSLFDVFEDGISSCKQTISSVVIDELLDVERTPRKPQYLMAPEIPLVLRSCEFDALRFRCSSDATQALLTHLEQECRSYKLQAAIFHEALLSSSCVSYEYDQLKGKTKKKEASHIALMSRPTEPSYDERRAKLNAGAGAKK